MSAFADLENSIIILSFINLLDYFFLKKDRILKCIRTWSKVKQKEELLKTHTMRQEHWNDATLNICTSLSQSRDRQLF